MLIKAGGVDLEVLISAGWTPSGNYGGEFFTISNKMFTFWWNSSVLANRNTYHKNPCGCEYMWVLVSVLFMIVKDHNPSKPLPTWNYWEQVWRYPSMLQRVKKQQANFKKAPFVQKETHVYIRIGWIRKCFKRHTDIRYMYLIVIIQ